MRFMICSVLTAASSTAVAIVPASYSIVDVGAGDFSGNPATPSLNDHGQVVLGFRSPAVVWQNGVTTPLGGPGDTAAFLINNMGEAVGGRGIATGSASPVGWFSTGFQDFASVLPGGTRVVTGLNDNGDVAVSTSAGGVLYHRNGTQNTTGLQATGGINNSGTIVGNINGSRFSAGRSVGGVASALPGIPVDSIALGISNSGLIVGTYDFGNSGGRRPFLWSAGSVQFLPVLDPTVSSQTVPVSINNAGDAVGYSLGTNHFAIVWSEGNAIDLSTRLLNGQGWSLSSATSINALGQIVGSGIHNGQSRVFLLSPVPTPSTFAFTALCSVAVMRRRSR